MDARNCHASLPLRLVISCIALLLLLPPLSGAAATAVTHLPWFDGALPFYLETGYVGVEEATGTELFYYFVESERSRRTDLFVEKRYNGTLPQLVYNPYSWTQMASIIFVDSPRLRDVGDISSSLQILTFLRKWFGDHPQYRSNPFYIGGDSHAGKMTPVIAHYMFQKVNF
uniref:Uncharacterized protein n=1 Tax=Setaria italica TaxID=4555 RepID=K4AMT2_SETIT